MGFAKRERDRRHQARPDRDGPDPEGAAHRDDGDDRLRFDRLHQRRHRRSGKDADRHVAHRDGRHLPLSGVSALSHGADCRDSHFANWRAVPDAGVWLQSEPAHAPGDRVIRRSGGG